MAHVLTKITEIPMNYDTSLHITITFVTEFWTYGRILHIKYLVLKKLVFCSFTVPIQLQCIELQEKV